MSFKIVVDALPSGEVMVGASDEKTATSFTMSADEAEQFAYLLLDRSRRAKEPEEVFMAALEEES